MTTPKNVTPMPHGIGRHGELLPIGSHVSHYRRDRKGTVMGAWLDSSGISKIELLGDNGITTQIKARYFKKD